MKDGNPSTVYGLLKEPHQREREREREKKKEKERKRVRDCLLKL